MFTALQRDGDEIVCRSLVGRDYCMPRLSHGSELKNMTVVFNTIITIFFDIIFHCEKGDSPGYGTYVLRL